MKLVQLAKIILSIENDGLSKVRFAKIIYFIHKDLIRRGLMEPNDIRYIRMPLGPVPVGFMTIEQDNDEIYTELKLTGLSYNSRNYLLKKRINLLKKVTVDKDALYDNVESALKKVKKISTSDLIEFSHRDNSWVVHRNGEEYTITRRDLKNNLLINPKSTSIIYENQRIQASLVAGMIEDIVSESTALEHPDEEITKTEA